MAKQKIYDGIHAALGLRPRPLAEGGTPHAEVITAIAVARNVPLHAGENKVARARRVVEAAGNEWVAGTHDSTLSGSGGGGNITSAGLELLLSVMDSPADATTSDPATQAVFDGLCLVGVESDDVVRAREPAPLVDRPATTMRRRDARVVAAVLRRAAGRCESCGMESPFDVIVGGEPRAFLEVHHVRPLSQEGSDRPENAVAVCPNCHRALHFATDRVARMEDLYRNVPSLERED